MNKIELAEISIPVTDDSLYSDTIKRQAERIMNRMKVTNLETAMVNTDDVEYKDGDKLLTLRRVMVAALAAGLPSDQGMQAKEKEHCYDLMLLVKSANGELELESEDATIIKNRINQMYPPIVVGQAVKLIEGKAASPSANTV